MRTTRLITLCLFMPSLSGPLAMATVSVYDYPDSIRGGNRGYNSRSKLYAVNVVQDDAVKSCYVMFDKNQETHGNLALNPDNHWTNFSFSDDVTIEIARLDGKPITECRVHPLKKGYHAVVSGNKARIAIPGTAVPLQLWVEMNDMEMNPLFVYCDPPETDVPDRSSDNVAVVSTSDGIERVRELLTGEAEYVVFEEGVHAWGGDTGSGYRGYKLPIRSGKKIYIPGGAYVVGSFYGENQSDFKIYGPGVLSACGLERLGGKTGIPYSMVYSSGNGKGQVLEGFISQDAPHFHLTVRGQVTIDNVKMHSWWHSTDGTVTGDNSVVRNCFFKVNDDVIKVYANHCVHENNTMYHQVNGAPFQFSWGSQHGSDNISNTTYIVNSVYKGITGSSNTAVINSVGGSNTITENNTWDGLYIDNGCHRLIGLTGKNKSTFRNFALKNVELNTQDDKAPQCSYSYLVDATYENFSIENLTVNGWPISGVNAEKEIPQQGQIWCTGKTEVLTFLSDRRISAIQVTR